MPAAQRRYDVEDTVVEIDFPRTDDLCSRLAFGTGRLHAHDLANVEATIRRAYDLGIRHFDSSVGYDHSVPHAALARLLRDVPERDIFISTKIGHFRPTFPQYRDLYRNADAIWGVVHECHRMLLGRIDLLQIHEADLRFWWDPHAPDTHTPYLEPEVEYDFAQAPVTRVMARAKSTGVCRYTGVTGNSATPLARVIGHIELDTIMCAYNLDPIFRGTMEFVAPAARACGLHLMAAGVLQGGSYLHPKNLPPYLARIANVPEKFRDFHRVQTQSGLSAVALLLRWSLSIEEVDRWVLGASRPEQIEQTMAILRQGPLESDLQDELDRLAIPHLDWRLEIESRPC